MILLVRPIQESIVFYCEEMHNKFRVIREKNRKNESE